MYFTRKEYQSDMEILVTEKNLVAFSGTVLGTNQVTENDDGKKYVLSGSLIDADGNIVTEKKVAETYSLSSTPVGVLYKTVDITYGNASGALIVEGYLRGDRVLEAFPNTKEEVKKTLSKIIFR